MEKTEIAELNKTKGWTKTLLKKLIKKGPTKLKFKKVDGTSRVMTCSLHPEDIPEDTDMNTYNDHVARHTLAVVDTEIGKWRSFRVDSVERVYVNQ